MGRCGRSGASPTHHNLYPLKARLIQGEPLRVVAERVDMAGRTLRGLVSRIDQVKPPLLPAGRGGDFRRPGVGYHRTTR